MSRYFLEISYCGTNYHGWQIQSNTQKTIQQILLDIMTPTLNHPVQIIGCGRTDTGVHAKQFFAHFDSDTLSHHPFQFWINKWNTMLPHDIAIQNLLPVHDHAHARYDAVSRTYEYHIHQKKNAFLYPFSWYYTKTLHHDLIIAAIDLLKQHENFACFTKNADEYNNTLCTIYNAQWEINEHKIKFTLSANRFLRNMVRAIVGTLIYIGIQKLSLNDFQNILLSQNRKQAGFSAPPMGLHLTQIIYLKEIFLS